MHWLRFFLTLWILLLGWKLAGVNPFADADWWKSMVLPTLACLFYTFLFGIWYGRSKFFAIPVFFAYLISFLIPFGLKLDGSPPFESWSSVGYIPIGIMLVILLFLFCMRDCMR